MTLISLLYISILSQKILYIHLLYPQNMNSYIRQNMNKTYSHTTNWSYRGPKVTSSQFNSSGQSELCKKSLQDLRKSQTQKHQLWCTCRRGGSQGRSSKTRIQMELVLLCLPRSIVVWWRVAPYPERVAEMTDSTFWEIDCEVPKWVVDIDKKNNDHMVSRTIITDLNIELLGVERRYYVQYFLKLLGSKQIWSGPDNFFEMWGAIPYLGCNQTFYGVLSDGNTCGLVQFHWVGKHM